MRQHAVAGTLWLLSLLACVLIYSPALKGPFLLDDFHNLQPMAELSHDASAVREFVFSASAGPLGRPLAKLSFLIDDFGWPSAAAGYKRTNLLLHLMSGCIALLLFLRLAAKTQLRSSVSIWCCLLSAAIWLLHPLNVSTTMYVVQRMAQLSAIFSLLACYSFVVHRDRAAAGSLRSLAFLTLGVGSFTLMGIASKETAVLTCFYILLIDTLFFSKQSISRSYKVWRALFVYAPCFIFLLLIFDLGRWQPGYAVRDFSLPERLLTQPLILLEYLYRIFSFRTLGLGLFQDDQTVIRSILSPGAYLPIIFWIAVMALALRFRRICTPITFGLLWFICAHLAESTTIGLELYFEHRNYLASLGLIFGIGLSLGLAVSARDKTTATAAGALGGVLALLAAVQTASLTQIWGNSDLLRMVWATEHPDSARATRTLARWLEKNAQPESALNEIDRIFALQPHDISLPLTSIDISCGAGLPYRYELESLNEDLSRYWLTNGVVPAAISMQEKLVSGACKSQESAFLSFLEASSKLEPKVAAALVDLSKLHHLAADLHRSNHDYQAMLNSLLAAYDSKRSAANAVKIAEFWILAGNYDFALEWLDQTQALASQERSWLQPDQSELFSEKRALLKKMQNKQESES